MKRRRQFKTEEQTATARSKCRVAMKRKWQSNTEEQLHLLGQKQSCDEKASVQH